MSRAPPSVTPPAVNTAANPFIQAPIFQQQPMMQAAGGVAMPMQQQPFATHGMQMMPANTAGALQLQYPAAVNTVAMQPLPTNSLMLQPQQQVAAPVQFGAPGVQGAVAGPQNVAVLDFKPDVLMQQQMQEQMQQMQQMQMQQQMASTFPSVISPNGTVETARQPGDYAHDTYDHELMPRRRFGDDMSHKQKQKVAREIANDIRGNSRASDTKSFLDRPVHEQKAMIGAAVDKAMKKHGF